MRHRLGAQVTQRPHTMKLMIMLLISAATGAVEAGWSEGKCQRLKTRFKTTFEKVEMWKKNCFVGNFLTAKKCIDDKKSLYTSFKKVAKWEKECLPPPYKFTSKDDLKTKLQAFYDDAASTEATYGPVATWDVSGVSDMSYLFSVNNAFEMDDIRWITNDFNEDISGWDTSAVTNMDGMFQVCAAGFHKEPLLPLPESPTLPESPSRPSRTQPQARPAPRTALCMPSRSDIPQHTHLAPAHTSHATLSTR